MQHSRHWTLDCHGLLGRIGQRAHTYWPAALSQTPPLLAPSCPAGPVALSTVAAVAAHDKDINALAFSPNDSLLATASQDKTIKLWTLPNLVLRATLRGHKRGVWDVAFSPAEQVCWGRGAFGRGGLREAGGRGGACALPEVVSCCWVSFIPPLHQVLCRICTQEDDNKATACMSASKGCEAEISSASGHLKGTVCCVLCGCCLCPAGAAELFE